MMRAAAAVVVAIVLAAIGADRIGLLSRWQSGQGGQVAAHHPSPSTGARLEPPPSVSPNATSSRPEIVVPGHSPLHVPVLMYHYIRVAREPRGTVGYNLSVTPDDFRAQMDWLAQNGYHAVTLRALSAYLAKQGNLPSRPVVLTFDDGYADFYSVAWPVLRQHQFAAVSYVVSGFLGTPGYITAEQVAELDHAGIEIGAHTVTHVDLTTVQAAEVGHQVADSKSALEQILNHPVLDFCYPSGRHNAAVVKAVQAAGFDTATTTQFGTAESTDNRYVWPRVRVEGGEPLARFGQNLGAPDPTVGTGP